MYERYAEARPPPDETEAIYHGIGHYDDTPLPIALFYDMLDRPPPIGDGDFYGRNAQRTGIVEHVLVLDTTCDSSIELSRSQRRCGHDTSALDRSGRSSIGSSMQDAAHSLILKDEISNGLLARLQRNTLRRSEVSVSHSQEKSFDSIECPSTIGTVTEKGHVDVSLAASTNLPASDSLLQAYVERIANRPTGVAKIVQDVVIILDDACEHLSGWFDDLKTIPRRVIVKISLQAGQIRIKIIRLLQSKPSQLKIRATARKTVAAVSSAFKPKPTPPPFPADFDDEWRMRPDYRVGQYQMSARERRKQTRARPAHTGGRSGIRMYPENKFGSGINGPATD